MWNKVSCVYEKVHDFCVVPLYYIPKFPWHHCTCRQYPPHISHPENYKFDGHKVGGTQLIMSFCLIQNVLDMPVLAGNFAIANLHKLLHNYVHQIK